MGGAPPSLDALAAAIAGGRHTSIVALVGAGISTSAGIPDFRSPNTGLYANLAKYNLPTPTAVFDIAYFGENPAPFFQLARELYPGQFNPTAAHCLLRLLHDRGLLRRVYTQNIDTLERRTGLPADSLVEAHGSFASATCVECRDAYSQNWMHEALFSTPEGKDPIPRCDRCGGVVKPDITFYGEEMPPRFRALVAGDAAAADLLLIMGTSLKVFPIASLPGRVSLTCPRLLINGEVVGAVLPPDREERTMAPPGSSSASPGGGGSLLRGVGSGGASPAGKSSGTAVADSEAAASSALQLEPLAVAPLLFSTADPSAGGDDGVGGGSDGDDGEEGDDDDSGLSPSGEDSFSSTAFRFGRRDNYRDVLLRGDVDAGVWELVRALDVAAVDAAALVGEAAGGANTNESVVGGVFRGGWERDLGALLQGVRTHSEKVPNAGIAAHGEASSGELAMVAATAGENVISASATDIASEKSPAASEDGAPLVAPSSPSGVTPAAAAADGDDAKGSPAADFSILADALRYLDL